jgi:hypothetical protein
MTFQSRVLPPLEPRQLADFGFARARDLAFDAIHTLWRRRQAEGMKQTHIVDAIGRDPGWVSRTFRGPGNWTLRTLGELVEALNGELEIIVHAKEDVPERLVNYSAYEGYHPAAPGAQIGGLQGGNQVIGTVPAGFSGRPLAAG